MASNSKSFAHKIRTVLAHWFIPQRSNNHRPKILHPDSLFVIAFAAIGLFALVQTVKFFPSLNYSILGFSSDITVEKVVAQTNQERVKAGLEPVTYNQQLSAAALSKAQDMFSHQYWAHVSPQGKEPWDFINQSGYRYRVAGENLARDFHHASDMMKAWMASPTHKANILNGRYDEIGVAVVGGELEGFETVLVVQMFGSPPVAQASIGDQATNTQTSPAGSPNQSAPADQAESEYKSVSADQPASQPQTDSADSQEQVLDANQETQEQEPSQTTQPETGVAPPMNNYTQIRNEQAILSQALVPEGGLYHQAVFNPLALTKIFFLGVILVIVITLIYDSFVIGHRKTMRVVGNNLGHIILFTGVAFLMILFKGGMIK